MQWTGRSLVVRRHISRMEIVKTRLPGAEGENGHKTDHFSRSGKRRLRSGAGPKDVQDEH